MTALDFIFSVITMFLNFLFNIFRIPNTVNVYLGWLMVSAIVMGITIKSILNVASGIQARTTVRFKR